MLKKRIEPIAFVLGLAPSIDQYFAAQEYCDKNEIPTITIGVNDIWRYVSTDVIVCIDHKHCFSINRQKIIEKSKPSKFVSHNPHWCNQENFEFIKLTPVPHTASTVLSEQRYQSGLTSTFVACQYAAKSGYKNIVMFGVDVYGHRVLDTPPKRQAIITNHLRLKNQLENYGVSLMVGNEDSLLAQVLPAWKPTI